MQSIRGAPYPWQASQWQRLVGSLERLPHALVLTGQPGLGKRDFARRFAHVLLCRQPSTEGIPCETCKGCRLFAAGTHPDLGIVEPLEEGRVITVDQVRTLVEFAIARPHTAARKVVLLIPAERMNINAANALLKILEEPPPDNVFLLVSDDPGRLPPTVRSRCQRIQFKSPAPQEGLAWLAPALEGGVDAKTLLELAAGAPLRALELARSELAGQRVALLTDLEALAQGQQDPIACAARWAALGVAACLTWMQAMVADMVKLAMLSGEPPLANPDLAPRLHGLVQGLDLRQLYGFAEDLGQARALAGPPLDVQLLLEDILIRWSNLRKNLRESV